MHNCKHATLIHIYNNVCALPSWSCLGCETNKIATFPLLTADLARVFSHHNANILHIECTMQIVLIPELQTRQYTAAFACDKSTAPGSVFLRSKTQHLSVNAAPVTIVSPTMPPFGRINAPVLEYAIKLGQALSLARALSLSLSLSRSLSHSLLFSLSLSLSLSLSAALLYRAHGTQSKLTTLHRLQEDS